MDGRSGGAGGPPPRDEAGMARANRRTAIVLGLAALAIYGWFILRHVLRAQGAGS